MRQALSVSLLPWTGLHNDQPKSYLTPGLIIIIIIFFLNPWYHMIPRDFYRKIIEKNVKMGMSLRAVTGWKTVMQQNCIIIIIITYFESLRGPGQVMEFGQYSFLFILC